MAKYRFSVSTKYVGSEVTEDFTPEELGIEDDTSDIEIDDILEESYKNWLVNNTDGYIKKIDEN